MKEQSNLRLDTRVSLFFEGLMLTCFTKDKRCQVGIYTHPINADHLFTVSVYDARKFRNGAIAYKRYTCAELREAAPLWLYVDLGDGLQKNLFTATRFARNEIDPRSFDHVLDFDGPELHGPPDQVTLNPDALSILNLPQGIFYAAQLDDFQRSLATDDDHGGHTNMHMGSHPGKNESEEPPMPLLNKSALVGAQIELPEKENLALKLETSAKEALLNVPLEAGVQYTVYIEHAPEPPADPHEFLPVPRSHFHRFYDAITTKSGIRYTISGLAKTMEMRCPPYDPPCTAMTVGNHDSLENA